MDNKDFVKTIRFIISLALCIFAVGAKAESLTPINAINEIKRTFPNCNISASSVGPLYGKDRKDVAASLECEADVVANKSEISGPYAIAILAEGSNGGYRIAYKARGLLTYCGTDIKNGSVFLHNGFPGTDGGQTATSIDYQFRYRGEKLMLIGMELNVIYIGNDTPIKDQEYRVSVNYLSGMVIDSRKGLKAHKIAQPRKISLEEFNFEPDMD